MASELDNLRQCVLDAVEDKRREISDPVIYLCGIQRTQNALIGALESRLSECQERERKLREACEAVLAKINWRAATHHPITQNLNYLGYGEEVREMTQKLSAALEVKE